MENKLKIENKLSNCKTKPAKVLELRKTIIQRKVNIYKSVFEIVLHIFTTFKLKSFDTINMIFHTAKICNPLILSNML